MIDTEKVAHGQVVLENRFTREKLYYCAKCEAVHEGSVQFGMLTPRILVDIIELVEKKTITRATGHQMIGWYMSCDPSIRSKN